MRNPHRRGANGALRHTWRVQLTWNDLADSSDFRVIAKHRIYRREFQQVGKALALDVPGSLTLDNTRCMIEPAAGGARLAYWLAYLPEQCVEKLIRRGDLCAVLMDWSTIGPGFHLYHSGRRQLPTGLRLLIDLAREMQPLAL